MSCIVSRGPVAMLHSLSHSAACLNCLGVSARPCAQHAGRARQSSALCATSWLFVRKKRVHTSQCRIAAENRILLLLLWNTTRARTHSGRYWGFFRYKKRLFSIQDIIIYHYISRCYHCVSLCIIVDITIYHVPRRHMISMISMIHNTRHDIPWYMMLVLNTWYQHDITKNKIMIHRQKISCPVSCRVSIMFWYQWYMDMIPEWHDLGYEMTNNLYLYFYFMISLIYLSVSCDIMWYHVISCDTCIKRVSLADLSVRGSRIP